MARRKSNRSRSIEPAVMTMSFDTDPVNAGILGRAVIDISQVASILNRRFYRQGLNWAVAGISVHSPEPCVVYCTKLPNTWVMSNAWMKAFSAWRRMNAEASSEVESIIPKFQDFKIYMDDLHHSDGFGDNQLPVSFDSAGTVVTAVAGEWEATRVVVPFGPSLPGNTTAFEMIAVGASFPGAGNSGINAASIIEGYAASRLLPNKTEPNAPDDAKDTDGSTPENWLSAIFNEGTDQTSDVIGQLFVNNQEPYPFENDGVHLDTMYPGGANQLSALELHDYTTIYSTSATTSVGKTRIKGGNFPCGLIGINWIPTAAPASLVIQVDLVPGTHRGYLAQPMQEM